MGIEPKPKTPEDGADAASSVSAGAWRDETRFNQAERYDGGQAATAGRRPLIPVIMSGVAMIVTTFVIGALGAPGWAAAAIGVAVFAIALIVTRPGRPDVGGVTIDDDETLAAKLKAAGIDRADLETALTAAEAELDAIDETAATLHHEGFRPPLRRLTRSAREILQKIAKDPADLRRARRFLKVYIPSARASVEKFAALGVINDPAIDAKFQGMIDDMIAATERRRDALSLDDKIDLETEIDVLAERLSREA